MEPIYSYTYSNPYAYSCITFMILIIKGYMSFIIN